ncbi:MAG: TonB family protein, partial [Acidobacteriota bacterium]
MSYQPLWLRDLVAYSIQAAAMVGVGVVMARLLRLRVPRVRMTYWQGLVALCLFLPLLQPWRPEVLETAGTVLSNVNFAASVPAAAPTLSLAEVVLLLICTGIIVRAAWMMLGLLRLWLYRREAQRIEEVPQAVAEAQRLVPVAPALFISPRLETPATFGYFRPVILFPARFLKMEPSMQKAIALHELLHVERRDWLWNLLEETVLTLLWFHLPLWWAVRSIRLSREQVVDAESVRRSNARRPYLKALLEMAGQKRLAESLPAALFLRESQLAERVALMMKEAQMSRKQLTVSILTAAGVLLIAGASVVWAFPLKTAAQQSTATEASSAAMGAEVSADASSSRSPALADAESVQKSTKVYKVGGDVQPPEAIKNTDPPYTPEARKAQLSGTVVLQAVIDAKGRVVSIKELSKPLGKGLDESAMNTVRKWTFHPATRNGVPVPVRVSVEIGFRYDPDKKPDPQPQPNPQPDPQPDPQPQVKQHAPESPKESSQEIKINQAEIQRQIEEAMKQAEIARKASAKVDQAKIQKQVEEAMKQLKAAKIVAPKIDEAEIRRQVEEAMKQAKIAQLAASKIDQAKIQEQVDEAMKQLKAAKIVAPKIDEAKIRRQVEEAMKQAEFAKQEAKKINKEEIRREVERAKKQAEAAQLKAEAEKARKDAEAARAEVEKIRKQAEAARKEAEKARKQEEKDRLKHEEQQEELKPLPPQPPAPPAPPATPSSKDLPAPPPPPPPQN